MDVTRPHGVGACEPPATTTLTDFLLARIAEDEMIANEAGRHYDEPPVESGEHWRWECSDDEVVVPNFDVEFMECSHGDFSMSLRSVENYPYRSIPGAGPSIHLSNANETTPVLAAHIARHDPARVLAECAAKRAIAAMHLGQSPNSPGGVYDPGCEVEGYGLPSPDECETLRALAAIYADHPEYRSEWAP